MSINPSMVWIIIILAMVIAEIITVGFFPITVAVGGIFALLISLITDVIWAQVLVFLFSSIIFFMFLKPLINKLFPPKEGTKTAVERLIGQTGVVISKIDNKKNIGQIRVSGEIWSAKSNDDNVIIEEDLAVEIIDVQGVKTIVKRK
ncbi:MAG: NfeD family protein [Clostridia bacterium]